MAAKRAEYIVDYSQLVKYYLSGLDTEG